MCKYFFAALPHQEGFYFFIFHICQKLFFHLSRTIIILVMVLIAVMLMRIKCVRFYEEIARFTQPLFLHKGSIHTDV